MKGENIFKTIYFMPMVTSSVAITIIFSNMFGYNYGIINWFGVPWSGTGAQLEVYADKVVFRPRSFLTGHWYVNSTYTFELTSGEGR